MAKKQAATKHGLRVVLHTSKSDEPVDGGIFEVEGEPYELSEDRALELALKSEHLDLRAAGGAFVRWRGHLIPQADFRRLEVTVVSASKLD